MELSLNVLSWDQIFIFYVSVKTFMTVFSNVAPAKWPWTKLLQKILMSILI